MERKISNRSCQCIRAREKRRRLALEYTVHRVEWCSMTLPWKCRAEMDITRLKIYRFCVCVCVFRQFIFTFTPSQRRAPPPPSLTNAPNEAFTSHATRSRLILLSGSISVIVETLECKPFIDAVCLCVSESVCTWVFFFFFNKWLKSVDSFCAV